jgi:hypothetical protein
MISKTNINQYKPTPVLVFPILYFIITLFITLLIALCIDIPLLGIVSDLLHLYILVLLIAFHMQYTLENTKKSYISLGLGVSGYCCLLARICGQPIWIVCLACFSLACGEV